MSQAPSLQRTSYFSWSSVLSHAFSVLCVYSTFRHHPHLLGYLRAKFHFLVTSVAELAHAEKSRTLLVTDSVTHPDYLMPGNRSFWFGLRNTTVQV